jgi:cell division protease FtsH
MVTSFGMSERLGAVKLGEENNEPFLGRDIGHQRNYSEEVAAIIDEEVNRLITNAHQEAFDVLNENREVLDALVLALLERETLDRKQLGEIFVPLQLRPEREPWTGSESRIPSTKPPVQIDSGFNGQKPGLVIGPSEGGSDVVTEPSGNPVPPSDRPSAGS